MMRTSY